MDQKVSYLFYPRKPKNYVAGNDIPVYMRITVKNANLNRTDKVDFSTGKCVNRSKWSSASNRLTGRTEQVQALNDYLDLLELKVVQSHNHLLRLGHEVTAEKIKLLVAG